MERPILFINACVRKESRTKRLAEKLLQKLNTAIDELTKDGTIDKIINKYIPAEQ